MTEHIQKILEARSTRFSKPPSRWWGFVWRGLVVSSAARHYKAMGRSVWLYLYLIIHADRKTGKLYRKISTMEREIGISKRTVQAWLKVLRDGGYIVTTRTGRALVISISKWRPIGRYAKSDPSSVSGQRH